MRGRGRLGRWMGLELRRASLQGCSSTGDYSHHIMLRPRRGSLSPDPGRPRWGSSSAGPGEAQVQITQHGTQSLRWGLTR